MGKSLVQIKLAKSDSTRATDKLKPRQSSRTSSVARLRRPLPAIHEDATYELRGDLTGGVANVDRVVT